MTNPTCPICDRAFSEDEAYNFRGKNQVNSDDGDISDLTCPRCDRKFHVVCEHDIKWKPCDEDGELI